ncbi:MAG TPA: EamA family transporter [Anaerolineales bacterium]|nr:EamA family transporter [Anaerolineales bacterium]
MQDAFLFFVTALIWGSTWLAITFQLGTVSPEASIVYRFALAALILAVFAWVRRLPMRFSLRQHAFIALQGTFLFSINYILVYLAELYLPSGLVAIIFSTIIITNVLFGALFLGNPVRPRVVAGALIGMAGLAMVFWPQLRGLDFSGTVVLGLLFSFGSLISASLGNILSARNQRNGLPVVQTNAFGMAYGALVTLAIALVRGATFGFEPTGSYIFSLLYLSVFGSVIAFGSYLTLIGRLGVDRAAYVMVVFPLVALALSTLYEGLGWSTLAFAGVGLVILGNVLALRRRRRPPTDPAQASS